MIREYRIILGKQPIGSNILFAPPTSFVIGLTPVIGWQNVVRPGKEYRFYMPFVNYTYDPTAPQAIFFGDLSSRFLLATKGYYQIDSMVIKGLSVGIYGPGGTFDFPNTTLYELAWNDPLTTDPLEWRELKLSMQRDIVYNGLFKTYSTDLTFEKDGYEYIRKAYAEQGLDSTIPVLIEEFCGNGWADKFEGLIRISDCVFDLSKCTVKAKIEDAGAATILKGGQELVLSLTGNAGSFPLHQGNIDCEETNAFFDDGDNYIYTNKTCYNLYNLIRRVITECTDNQMDFVSDYFSQIDFNWALAKGYQLIFGYTGTNPPIALDMSFKKLFIELDKIFNLSISFEKNNNINFVRIEPKSYYESNTPVINLTNIDNLAFKFNLETLYKTIRIGYDQKYGDPNDLKFNSTEGDVKYFQSLDFCTEGTLDIVSNFIGNSDLILHSLSDGAGGSDLGYGNRMFITRTDGLGNALSYFNVTNGKYYYNDPIKPLNNFLNRLPTLRGKRYQGNTDGAIYFTPKPLVRLWEINTPLTPTQIDLLRTAGQSITFSGKGQIQPLTGYITGLEYEFKTGMAKIQVLTE